MTAPGRRRFDVAFLLRPVPDGGVAQAGPPVSVTVTLYVGGLPLVAQLDDDALATIAAAIQPATVEPSPYLTVPEAAEHLRCNRQRIDDLLSSRRLHRIKDGSRTLIRRDEIDAYLAKRRSN